MNRILVVALASLLAAPAWAAKDPCKGVKVKKDAFGATRVLQVGDLTLKRTPDEAWSFTLGFNHGGGYGAFSANSQEVLPEGTVVEMLLGDGSSTQISSVSNSGPSQVSIMGITVTHYDMVFGVDKAAVDALTSQPIQAYRILKGTDTWHTEEVKKGDAKKFHELAACLVGS